METAIRVDRELDRLVELEDVEHVYFRVPDTVFDEFNGVSEGRITVRRISLYEEWDRHYLAKDVKFSRHVDGFAIMALPK